MELSIECLSKRFGSKIAVNNISVTLQPGVYGLLGANGAGKTTLMRMVCDVLKPTSGRILYNGKEIEQLGEHYRSYLGYLPQDFGYYPDFTAKEYLNFIAAIKGIDTVTAKKQITELLFENSQKLQYALPLDLVLDESSSTDRISIPFHPGAADYYTDCSIDVTTKEGNK